MKVHYKGFQIYQAIVDPTYSDMWGFGSKKSRIGWGVRGLCLAERNSFMECKQMIDDYVAGKIKI